MLILGLEGYDMDEDLISALGLYREEQFLKEDF